MEKPRLKYGQFQQEQHSVAWVIRKYITESEQPGSRKLGGSHRYTLLRMERSPFGAKALTELRPIDFVDYCKWRRASGVQPQTINQDATFLSGVIKYAAQVWETPGAEEALLAFQKSKPQLVKQQLVAKAQSRTRRPTPDELEQLFALFDQQDRHHCTKVPMRQVVEFQIASGRRIGETCRLRWGDVDFDKRLCLVRDLKNPKGKGFHDTFPLLGRAWEIVLERQKERLDPNDPNERIFPYASKTCSARYTLAKKKLGIKDLRLHDCRRHCISGLFEQGYNVPEVAKVSLHRNPTLLLKTYTALKPEDLHLGPAARRNLAQAVPSD